MYKRISLTLLVFFSFNILAMDSLSSRKVGTLSVVNKSDNDVSITVTAPELLHVRRVVKKVNLHPGDKLNDILMLSDYDVVLGWKRGVVCYGRPITGALKVVESRSCGFELAYNSIKKDGESKG